MKRPIIAISGLAGAGKDTAADVLVQCHGFVRVALADPLKRIARDVFAFSDQQMWGPSASRNAPDARYPRTTMAREWMQTQLEFGRAVDANDIEQRFGYETPEHFLTPRHALQTLGSEWGRDCYEQIWLEIGLRTAHRLLASDGFSYTPKRGIFSSDARRPDGVVIPDIRFANELDAVRRVGGFVIRIVRPNAGLKAAAAMHRSEAEQAAIPDESFDGVLRNAGTIAALARDVRVMLENLLRRP